MTKKQIIGIVLSAASYPAAYVLATIMYKATYILDIFYPGVVPIASMDVSIYSLMVAFNVISVICAFGKDVEKNN